MALIQHLMDKARLSMEESFTKREYAQAWYLANETERKKRCRKITLEDTKMFQAAWEQFGIH